MVDTPNGPVVHIWIKDTTAIMEVKLWLNTNPDFDVKACTAGTMITFVNLWFEAKDGVLQKCTNVQNKTTILKMDGKDPDVENRGKAILAAETSNLTVMGMPEFVVSPSASSQKTSEMWAAEEAELSCCALLHSIRQNTDDANLNGLKKITGAYLFPDLTAPYTYKG